MLFTSFEFIYFFLIILIMYWSIPQRYRWVLLLAASYIFYISWEPTYIILILLSTSIDFFLCRFLTGSDEDRKRKTGLILSVLMNLGLLFIFKYYNFFQGALSDILGLVQIEYQGTQSSFLLPVGISFYTFQTISYSIDVYKKNFKVEKHFGKFALYVAYFPQLVAGPIERASNLLPQFNTKKLQLKANDLRDGALLFLWGLFKKVVVADNVRILADHAFNNSEYQSGGAILFALFAFTVQIYADFSGYSDMVIGASKMFGINLNINFRTPYFSQSITEFWRRWHITLSYWLRDYVFIPLGGSRAGRYKTLRNVFITFFLAGIWHGASWTFLIWGALHGIIVIIERLTGWGKNAKSSALRFFKILITFGMIVLTMLPVRAANLSHLKQLIGKLLETGLYDAYLGVAENLYTPGMLGIVILFFTDLFISRDTILNLNNKHWLLRYSWMAVIILLIIFLGDTAAEAFFYFQF